MKMKTIKSVFVTFLVVAVTSVGLTSCSNNKSDFGKTNQATVIHKVVKPDTLNMSKDTLARRVQQKTMKEVEKQQALVLKEALAVVTQTNNAINFIHTGHVKKAEAAIKTALENTRTLLKKNPGADLFPVDESVNVHDLVTTIPQVVKAVKAANTAMTKGNYQAASALLNGLKSEMDIVTINLPLSTYPGGLKQALSLFGKNKTQQAQQVLLNMMNSLVVNQVVIPLPILRAQVMMAESRNLFNKKEDKSKVTNLLENADYQLKLAQALGYRNFDKEYTDISKDIANVKNSVKKGNASQGIFDKLIKKTEGFKNRLINHIERKAEE